MSPIRTKTSHPGQQDLAHVKTDLGTHLLAEGASPVRKQARRQSLPARLSSTAATKYSFGRGGKKRLSLGPEGPPSHHASDCDPEHLGLSSRQKRYYTLVMKVCHKTATKQAAVSAAAERRTPGRLAIDISCSSIDPLVLFQPFNVCDLVALRGFSTWEERPSPIFILYTVRTRAAKGF